MLVKDIPLGNLPLPELDDTVQTALGFMQEYGVRHLAVTQEGQLAGVCPEGLLLEMDHRAKLETIAPSFIKAFVKEGDHFLNAVLLAGQQQLTVIPVLNADGQLAGCIESFDLLKAITDFLCLKEPSGMMVLEMDSLQYSFSEISRIIEANDAQITQLNTRKAEGQDSFEVTVFINKTEISDIVASFQRYEYTVKYYVGEELYNNELKDNYENLMNYLNI